MGIEFPELDGWWNRSGRNADGEWINYQNNKKTWGVDTADRITYGRRFDDRDDEHKIHVHLKKKHEKRLDGTHHFYKIKVKWELNGDPIYLNSYTLNRQKEYCEKYLTDMLEADLERIDATIDMMYAEGKTITQIEVS